MCSISKTKAGGGVAEINGRPVLQPSSCSNRTNTTNPSERRNNNNNSLKKVVTPPRTTADDTENNNNSLKSLERNKSKSFKESSLSYSSAMIVESPGSIAAVRRDHMALQHAHRKMRIAHYGRSKSAKSIFHIPTPTNCDQPTKLDANSSTSLRCSFITPTSDPVYIAYHDHEWGVPVHDDRLLFELLVLSGAQVGSDWASILKKRHLYREAFRGFDPEKVATLTDKQMQGITERFGIELSRIRGVVDNANRILEVKKEYGTLDKYMWGFVNNKAISTGYKLGQKVPAKTSKSESMSKDMVRRGFRSVGPTAVHSFMQAAGLTNDHLLTCYRHLPCTLLSLHHTNTNTNTNTNSPPPSRP